MNQQAEDAITAMLNCFPQTSQNYELLLGTLDRLCDGLTDQAIIEAAERFASGDVKEQSRKFAPSGPEFVAEARLRQEYLDLRARPRIPAPAFRTGLPAPFDITQRKARQAHAHLPVLLEDVGYDQFRKLSRERQIPSGATWVACLGTVFGPEPRQQSNGREA